MTDTTTTLNCFNRRLVFLYFLLLLLFVYNFVGGEREDVEIGLQLVVKKFYFLYFLLLLYVETGKSAASDETTAQNRCHGG